MEMFIVAWIARNIYVIHAFRLSHLISGNKKSKSNFNLSKLFHILLRIKQKKRGLVDVEIFFWRFIKQKDKKRKEFIHFWIELCAIDKINGVVSFVRPLTKALNFILLVSIVLMQKKLVQKAAIYRYAWIVAWKLVWLTKKNLYYYHQFDNQLTLNVPKDIWLQRKTAVRTNKPTLNAFLVRKTSIRTLKDTNANNATSNVVVHAPIGFW